MDDQPTDRDIPLNRGSVVMLLSDSLFPFAYSAMAWRLYWGVG